MKYIKFLMDDLIINKTTLILMKLLEKNKIHPRLWFAKKSRRYHI